MRQVAHIARSTLQIAGGLLGAIAQVLIAAGNFSRCRFQAAGTGPHRHDRRLHARQGFFEGPADVGLYGYFLNIQGHPAAPIDVRHQQCEFLAGQGVAPHRHGQKNLYTGLNHDIQCMQQHQAEVGLGGAIHPRTHGLQTVECNMVHGKHGGTKHHQGPVLVNQQQRNGDEYTEVEFDHALGQLDVQRDQPDLYKGQYVPARHRPRTAGIGDHRQQ